MKHHSNPHKDARRPAHDFIQEQSKEKFYSEAEVEQIVEAKLAKLRQINHTLMAENTNLKDRNSEMQEQIPGMEDHIGKTKFLRGVFELCLHCKSLRERDKAWAGMEEFLLIHTEAVFTHSVCPECMKHCSPALLSEIPAKDRKGIILQMKFKDFCDKEIRELYGSRLRRWFVNVKKSYDPMFPTPQIMEYTVSDFLADSRALHRIQTRYAGNDTLEYVKKIFAWYAILPFGD